MLILERIEVSPSQNKLIFSRDEPQKWCECWFITPSNIVLCVSSTIVIIVIKCYCICTNLANELGIWDLSNLSIQKIQKSWILLDFRWFFIKMVMYFWCYTKSVTKMYIYISNPFKEGDWSQKKKSGFYHNKPGLNHENRILTPENQDYD
jgi:hypothetical protein